MLVNNPMGSRRRRRFYHRAGVVLGPGGRFKTDLGDYTFFRFEPELYVQEEELEELTEEMEYNPSSRMTQGEHEDRESAKLNDSKKATEKDVGQPAAAAPAAEQPTGPAADQAATEDLINDAHGTQSSE